MSNKYNLTEGSVLKKLLLVAFPLIGSQVIQMTYNLTDMFWLGRLSSDAVAASGTAGMYMLISLSIMMIGRMGAEIGVAQHTGRQEPEIAKAYAKNSLTLTAIIGLVLAGLYAFGRGPLIGFFGIQEAHVASAAETYLLIVALGIPFTFITAVVTGIYNGSGNAKVPFRINCVGVAINVLLDPILIFPLNMGIAGAAVATAVAQVAACVLSLVALAASKSSPFPGFRPSLKLNGNYVKQILKWSIPIAAEGFLFTFMSMFVSRFVAGFGAAAISAQRIGSQIENLSWLIGGAFSSALTAFVGQNYGAKKWDRIDRGYRAGLLIMAVWGVAVAALMFFGAHFLFNIFLPNAPAELAIGVSFLRILSISQLFICFESAAMGAFRGLGQTVHPSIISAITNISRVLLAWGLMNTSLGLNGIWLSLTIGSSVRGLWMLLGYSHCAKKQYARKCSR